MLSLTNNKKLNNQALYGVQLIEKSWFINSPKNNRAEDQTQELVCTGLLALKITHVFNSVVPKDIIYV